MFHSSWCRCIGSSSDSAIGAGVGCVSSEVVGFAVEVWCSWCCWVGLIWANCILGLSTFDWYIDIYVDSIFIYKSHKSQLLIHWPNVSAYGWKTERIFVFLENLLFFQWNDALQCCMIRNNEMFFAGWYKRFDGGWGGGGDGHCSWQAKIMFIASKENVLWWMM